MEFGLSEEQTLLQDSVNRFLDEQSSLSHVREFVEAPDTDVWPGLVELGVPGILVAEHAGGLGMTTLDASIVAEALGAHTAPAPFIGSAVMGPVALQAAEANPDDLLGKLTTGERRIGIAVGDTIAARQDGGIQSAGDNLTGKALYVLDYGADVYLVADQDRSLFLVQADAPGLTGQALNTIDRTRRTGELVLDSVAALRLSSDPALCCRKLSIPVGSCSQPTPWVPPRR